MVGLTEQLIVGGSYAFTVMPAVAVADLPGPQAFLAWLAFLHRHLHCVLARRQVARIYLGRSATARNSLARPV